MSLPASNVRELRDPIEARRFVAQGVWLQRIKAPRAASVENALAWSLELAGQGGIMPPVGIVADVGYLLIEPRWSSHDSQPTGVEVPGWPAGVARSYEDGVLGKLDADSSFARGSDALARYKGRDFGRGLAFVLERLLARSGAGGVMINPVALKSDAGRTAEQVLAEGWDSLERDGPMPLLLDLYHEWIASARDLADALGPEDVFELEHGTALASFGQRIALRQVLQAAAEFEAAAPVDRPRPSGRNPDIATRFLDEDAYPVGGFSSISTRGSIESLLHSQLVFMERGERPDPFDIKFVRDELLYYSRDENEFRRRRRTFVFALYPDLAKARIKDPGLPRQRIVLLLGLLIAAVRRVSGWLGEDALAFEVVFLDGPEKSPLDPERELIGLILGEAIARGEVAIGRMPTGALADFCSNRGRRSLCHALAISTEDVGVPAESTVVSRLVLDGPAPDLRLEDEAWESPEGGDALGAWRAALIRLLGLWI